MSAGRCLRGFVATTLVLWVAVITAVGQPQQPPVVVAFTTARVPLDPRTAGSVFQQATDEIVKPPLLPRAGIGS